jgi:hypothetical protein
VRTRVASTRASEVSIRCTSDSLLISSEKKATALGGDRRVLGDVQRERRFPIEGRAATMTRSPFWKPAVMVQIGEPRRHAGDGGGVLREELDLLHRGPEQFLDPDESLPILRLGDLEDLLLRLVQDRLDLALLVEGRLDDPGRRLDEAPQDRLLPNDPA